MPRSLSSIRSSRAGFLILFLAVNLANVRLARETGSRAWLCGLAALTIFAALVIVCVEVAENPATRARSWILLAMVAASFALEAVYRGITKREIRLHAPAEEDPRRA